MLRCRYCSYAGPPEPGVQQQLVEAAHTLASIEARNRQLTDSQRRLLSRERSGLLRLTALVALVLCPLGFCASFGLIFTIGDRAHTALSLICASPFVFFAATAGAVLWSRLRYRRRLEAACAAVPPAKKGDPAGCHVCGAALPAPEVRAQSALGNGFVRCTSCAADNLVAPDVLKRVAGKAGVVISDLVAEVRREGNRLGLVSGISTVATVAFALLAPLTCCVSSVLISQWLWRVEQPINTADRYLLVDTEKGFCIARINVRYSDGTAHLILHGPRRPERSSNYVTGGARAAAFDANAIVGTQVTFPFSRERRSGAVLSVYKAPLDPANRAVVETRAGKTHWQQVNALCYDEAPEGMPVMPWPETSRVPRGAKRVE